MKRVIKRCYGCKRFNISYYPKPSEELIPTDRIKTRLAIFSNGNRLGKAIYMKDKRKARYQSLMLFICSLVRAVHLEILPNQTTQEFIQVLKRQATNSKERHNESNIFR